MAKERFRFTKVRNVKSPTRSNEGDAGLDFFIPEDLILSDLLECNHNELQSTVSFKDGVIDSIYLNPNSRILIPSGIRGLLEPKDSMLMVANKSGRASKLGLIFTAQICDSPYVGEYHLGVYNTSQHIVELKAGQSLVQMIHTPIFLTKPEEIDNDTYEKESKDWGTRGTNGFGSSDKKDYEPTNPQDVEGD